MSNRGYTFGVNSIEFLTLLCGNFELKYEIRHAKIMTGGKMNEELFWVDEALEEKTEANHYVSGCWDGRGDDEC